jgi:diguanylate cyclase (GGDEF)-like protein
MKKMTIAGGANGFGLDAGTHPPRRRLVRVLVVDDDPQAGALVEPALAEAPFEVEVETVSTAAVGLRRITADHHDIYLVDYSLPDGTGISLIHEARNAGIDKPFILITGYGNETLDDAALREGAADYLEKDLIGRHLERSVRYALRDWGATQTLKQLYQDVWAASVRDPLTGCFNRKHALEAIERELHRASRVKAPLSLIMFDLDHFKDINDRFGHLCGDAALQAVGRGLTTVLRSSDLTCRWGGDEFLMVLPDTPLAGARRAIGTLRHHFQKEALRWHEDLIAIKASFGITAVTPGELDIHAIIGRADVALYQAKQGGRDRVSVYGPSNRERDVR